VNVGWGSKATQFHGSLGKAAAKEGTTSAHEIGSSGDDDGLPYISWKGDGSTFVVSSLERSGPPITPRSTAATSSTSVSTTTHRRVLRYYSKTLTYLHPAEAIAGLEHSLAWRPSGSLVASTQRFSPTIPGLGRGKEGRHDIVFFEPNGLRHGEFALRGERWWKKGQTDPKSMELGYRVKQLLWNTDSTILAVWISVDDSKDVGE
jgi:elongator complex protein 1